MDGLPARSRRARFEHFEVDLRAGELWAHGRRVRLAAKPFDVLVALLERSGEVVLREELHHRLWPDKTYFDFDNNLNSAVATLREALGDAADSPRYVETLPKRGYRLLVPVEWAAGATNGDPMATDPLDAAKRPVDPALQLPTAPGERGRQPMATDVPFAGPMEPPPARDVHRRPGGWALAATLVTVLAASMWLLRDRELTSGTRLAVLPFEDISPGATAAPHFAAGVTEDVIATLGGALPARFDVIGPSSTRRYAETPSQPLARVVAELRADYVLQGTVRREGDRVRINAQLVEADGSVSWATSFDEPVRRILALQASIATRVARTLAVDLVPPQARAVDPAAHEALQRGRYLLRSRGVTAAAQARREIERALAIDPSYAAAWAALADAWSAGDLPPRIWAPRAAAAATRALAIDPHRADAHLRRAQVAIYFHYDWRRGELELAEAARLHPASPAVHQARAALFSLTGRHQAARHSMLRARSLDPVVATVAADAGWYEFVAREYRQTLVATAAALQLDPRHSGAHFYRYLAHQALGEWEAARRAAAAFQRLHGADRAAVAGVISPDDPRQGLTAFHRWNLARHRIEARQQHRSPAILTLDHLALGQHDAAVRALEQAYRERSGWLLPFMRVYPPLDPLRSHPGFRRLEQRLGLASYRPPAPVLAMEPNLIAR